MSSPVSYGNRCIVVASILCVACCYQKARAQQHIQSDDASFLQLGLSAVSRQNSKTAMGARSAADTRTATMHDCTGCTDDGSSTPEQCIRFMHIPKTGGTSIDSANMHQCPKVFDSFMLRTYQRIAKEMNPAEFQLGFGSSLGCMYDFSHETLQHYTMDWLPNHMHSYNYVHNRDGTFCEDLHAAPSDSQEVADFFTEAGCTTFCAVRDPFKRFLSAYSMMEAGPCDPAGFNAAVPSIIASLREKPCGSGCLFTPQVEMVYGVNNISLKTTQYCQRILHQEHLNEEFAALMRDLGQTMTLGEEHKMGEASYGHEACKVDAAAVPQEAKDLIYEYYRADYEAFEYARP